MWKRKSYVSGGADPTVVVEWSKNNLTVVEFQGTYILDVPGGKHTRSPFILQLAQELHEALEAQHYAEMVAEETEIMRANGGINPDYLIYRGP